MADYFTSQHFDLLNKWKGTVYDKTDPERAHAYEELTEAFNVTKRWADAVRAHSFPTGWTKTVRKPTDQWQRKFISYNWGRVYPSAEAPNELAYTVGIDAERGFVVKIDIIDTQTTDSTLRPRYEAIRDSASDFLVAVLPAREGLAKSFDDLVTWTIDAIGRFRPRYDDLVEQLGLRRDLSDEDLLKHFDGKPAFKTFRASWSPDERTLFCRLARAIHGAGMDWWHVTADVQLRFGRKDPGSERAAVVAGIVWGLRARTISWIPKIGDLDKLHRTPLTADVVDEIELALSGQRDSVAERLGIVGGRQALWPDQLVEESGRSIDEQGDGEIDEDDDDPQRPPKPINRIYFGPPGTGKTYEVSKLLNRDYSQSVASVSETEWRRQLIAEKVASLTWWEGVAAALYDLGGKAKVGELREHPYVHAIAKAKGRDQNITPTIWNALQFHTVAESSTVKVKLRMAPAVFDKTEDSVWHFAGEWEGACEELIALVKQLQAGPPKDGSVQQRFAFVTFHQSYGYEEFVEGLRPVLADDGESSEVRYEVRAGVFKDLCRKARQSPTQRFAIIIDEINRGNISKIFGELITLIEADKREGAENALSVTLPFSGESFSVPWNVDIIGTMNTADRSLALLDTALRRRFEFFPVLPDARDEVGAPLHGLRVTFSGKVVEIPKLLDAMNRRIEALYDRDHTIGHAYFTSLSKVPDGDERAVRLGKIFQNQILPLLEEFFFEDFQKVRLVLADQRKPGRAQFVAELPDGGADLAALFGDEGVDQKDVRRRYVTQAAAFSDPDAYLGIYQAVEN